MKQTLFDMTNIVNCIVEGLDESTIDSLLPFSGAVVWVKKLYMAPADNGWHTICMHIDIDGKIRALRTMTNDPDVIDKYRFGDKMPSASFVLERHIQTLEDIFIDNINQDGF